MVKPDDPLMNLTLGIVCLTQSTQRTTPNRHLQVLQAFTFLFKYYYVSNESNEANYNLGRAFQHINLGYLAVPYYEKVLSNENSTRKYEAAYNLSQIYMASGSNLLAEMILHKYCTIWKQNKKKRKETKKKKKKKRKRKRKRKEKGILTFKNFNSML